MPETSLLSRAKIFIEPADAAAGQRHLERVLERDAEDALAAVLAERPPARKLLLGVFGCSPHLANLAARDPARLARLLLFAPEAVVARLVDEARVLESADEAALMRLLRLVKQEAALVIALADLTKVWDTMTAARALTQIADATLRAAVAFTLREASIAGKLELFDHRAPERVAEQGESEQAWGGHVVEPQRLNVDGVHHEVVTVPAMPWRWGRADEAPHAAVIAQLNRSRGEQGAVLVAGAAGEFGDVGGDIADGPVPEAARGGRIRVVKGHGEAACSLGKAAPAELR